jgi:hypothetical protein
MSDLKIKALQFKIKCLEKDCRELLDSHKQMIEGAWIGKREIDQQNELIKQMSETLEFYAKTASWVQECDGNWYGVIVHEDISSIKCLEHEGEWGEPFADKGGKRARQLLESDNYKNWIKDRGE